MNIFIGTNIKRFFEAVEYKDNIVSVRLTDIDTTFWFDNQVDLQNFINEQEVERASDSPIGKKGYFDYKDETGTVHRYYIDATNRGEITQFREVIV